MPTAVYPTKYNGVDNSFLLIKSPNRNDYLDALHYLSAYGVSDVLTSKDIVPFTIYGGVTVDNQVYTQLFTMNNGRVTQADAIPYQSRTTHNGHYYFDDQDSMTYYLVEHVIKGSNGILVLGDLEEKNKIVNGNAEGNNGMVTNAEGNNGMVTNADTEPGITMSTRIYPTKYNNNDANFFLLETDNLNEFMSAFNCTIQEKQFIAFGGISVDNGVYTRLFRISKYEKNNRRPLFTDYTGMMNYFKAFIAEFKDDHRFDIVEPESVEKTTNPVPPANGGGGEHGADAIRKGLLLVRRVKVYSYRILFCMNSVYASSVEHPIHRMFRRIDINV
jgi:hypothetical protein